MVFCVLQVSMPYWYCSLHNNLKTSIYPNEILIQVVESCSIYWLIIWDLEYIILCSTSYHVISIGMRAICIYFCLPQ